MASATSDATTANAATATATTTANPTTLLCSIKRPASGRPTGLSAGSQRSHEEIRCYRCWDSRFELHHDSAEVVFCSGQPLCEEKDVESLVSIFEKGVEATCKKF